MSGSETAVTIGIDVGTEFVKAIVIDRTGAVHGRATVPTRGYFQACAFEAKQVALEDAGRAEADLVGIGATGFGAQCVPGTTFSAPDATCHAAGAHHRLRQPMTLVALGGRDPQVIAVDEAGRRVDARGSRRCAQGIGSFLNFAARHLDVHPSRLEELASTTDRAAAVSSYCSVFSGTAILECLREGATREEVALGAMRSIAERIVEIGSLTPPLVATGGVAEYYPGVLRSLEELTGAAVSAAPEPIYTAALGAALKAWPT